MSLEMLLDSTIKQYWWNEQPNFGDALAPRLTEFASGAKVLWASPDEAQLFGLGSILPKALMQADRRRKLGLPRAAAWGCGLMTPGMVPGEFVSGVDILSVRGPLTAICIGRPEAEAGDPGLLVKDMYPQARNEQKRYAVGIVVHHSQRVADASRKVVADRGWALIHAGTNDYDDVILKIAQCQVVLSTSLHGLVVADALGIVNDWLDPRGIHATERFKFFDYSNSVGRALGTPRSFGEIDAAVRAAKAVHRGYWERIDALNQQIRRSLRHFVEAGARATD